ncbi:VCBS domain-containing protein, partial [Rubrimonas cliftonensis]|uniref:VCBS domain-containing protein n=1 Tax=Rubrimonas cliftonensis TaxID=89524 RepID=UPI001587B966
MSEFTPSPISSGTTAGIFPYWADVDTRGGATRPSPGGTSQGTNLVHYDLDPAAGAVTVTWDDVGYFASRTDRLNAFQLVLTDVSDREGRSEGDFLISFRYENIDWTTGDASGGTNGLGGTVARAGYSAGDERGTFFELPASGDGPAMLALDEGPVLEFLSTGDGVTRPDNTPPVAAPDTATVAEDGAVTIDVLANDVDADGDTLLVSGFTQGAHGDVIESETGLTYRPDPDFNGADAFSYTISDRSGGSATTTVSITVTAVDDPAVAGGATTGRLGEDAAAVSGAISISDPDAGQNPSFAGATATGEFGAIAVNAAGTLWTYTLDNAAVQFLAAGQTATDALRLTASDGTTRDITVTIDGADDPAVAGGATTGRLGEDAAAVSGAISISDPDEGQNPSFAGATATGEFGAIAVNAAGTLWTYTLDNAAVQFLAAGQTATDALRLTASDGTTRDITITIDGADEDNTPPVATRDTATVAEDGAVTIDVLANDVDADGDTLLISGFTQGAHGDVIESEAGLTYRPDPDFNGADAFSYTISDRSGGSATTTVSITVTAVDDPAVAGGATTGRLGEDEPSVSGAISITDPDEGQNPSFAARTATGTYGAIAVNAAGTLWTYTLDNAAVQFLAAGQSVADALTLTASDGTPRAITLTIDGADDPAVAGGATTGRLGEDEPSVSGAISITDPDEGQNPSFAGRTATGTYGTIAVNAAGTLWTYTQNGAAQSLAAGQTVTDALTLTASDGATRDIVITIDGANEQPPAGPQPTEGPDRLTGTPQADAIDALGGNDTVKGLAGDDVLILGTGDDIALSGAGNDTVLGGDGDDTIKTASGADSIEGGAGDDIILSGNDDDTIFGGDGNDTIKPGRGDDVMDGGAGDDILVAFRGDEVLIGGDGNDTL